MATIYPRTGLGIYESAYTAPLVVGFVVCLKYDIHHSRLQNNSRINLPHRAILRHKDCQDISSNDPSGFDAPSIRAGSTNALLRQAVCEHHDQPQTKVI